MPEANFAHDPSIIYRPILSSDLNVLEQIHAALFPVRYEREFFLNVVSGHGIVSWAAVDVGPNSQGDELIGFVTARVITASGSEIKNLVRYDISRKDQTLVYILTLGVVENYQNLGIASSLVGEVIKYASSIASCRAVYLHVISCNKPAIRFYEKMQFKLLRRLYKFYYITSQHYDAYLFVYYVNGGQSPCSLLAIMAAVTTYFGGLLESLATKLQKNDKRKSLEWPECKEMKTLSAMPNKRIIAPNNAICLCI